jgi:hypothetical protein
MSSYADICWLAALGPVALMLYRVLVAVAMCDSGWVPVDREDVLATLGMRGELQLLDEGMDRLIAYDLVVQRRFDLIVRPVLPPLNDTTLRWMPPSVQRFHYEMTADGS